MADKFGWADEEARSFDRQLKTEGRTPPLSRQILDDLASTPGKSERDGANPQRMGSPSTPYAMADDTTTMNNLPTDGTTVVLGDTGYTRFGSKVRQVNQQTGETTWHEIGADGNSHVMNNPPVSMQMQEAMNAGYSPNRGTATSWEDAVAKQKADVNGEIRNRLLQRSEFLKKSVAERKKMRAQRDFDAADAARLALEQLDAGEGAIKTHEATGKQYRVVKIDGSTIDRITQGSEKMGRKSSLSGIRAYVQVDKDGNPVGEPKFYMTVNNDNGDGARDTKTTVPLDIARVMGQWAKSHSGAFGTSEEDAQRAAVDAFRFNGRNLNPMKWDIPVPAADKFEAQQDLAEMRRIAEAEAKAKAAQDKTEAEKQRRAEAETASERRAEREWILKNYKDLMFTTRKATDADVAAGGIAEGGNAGEEIKVPATRPATKVDVETGRAKEVGEPVEVSEEDAMRIAQKRYRAVRRLAAKEFKSSDGDEGRPKVTSGDDEFAQYRRQ